MGDPRVGDRVGPYRLLSDLGSGGMGTVFLAAVDDVAPGLRIGDRVALKIVHPSLVTDFDALSRFVQEAELGRRIRHENVVGTVDAGLDVQARGEVVYLTMEFVAGRTLAEILAEKGPRADGTCRRIGREVARGLAGIHEVGAVHGDLKPANVLMTPDEVVKVMDLGLAHLHGRALAMTEGRTFQGTILYAAPEQFGSAEGVSARTDLYALGLILYELATATHPFADDDPRVVIRRQLEVRPPLLSEVRPDVTPFLSEVVAKLLAKDPAQRFRSAREVFSVLARGEQSRWWRRRAAPGGDRHATALARLDVRRETLIRGRDAEIVLLLRALDLARRGEGRVVLVTGAPGIGRTRLLDAFARVLAVEDDPIPVRIGAHRRGRPHLEPYRDALDPESVCDLSRVVAQAEVPGGAVLVIDDLHLTDDQGRAFFLDVAGAVRHRHVLLVGTACDTVDRTFRAEVAGLPHAAVIELDGLDAAAIEGILTDLRQEPPTEIESRHIHELTGGHPLHVIETCGGDEARLPQPVRELFGACLRVMKDEDRDLLDAAACLGDPFTGRMLADLTGMAVGHVARSLTRLARRDHALRHRDDAWHFAFPALRELIRDLLSPALRAEYLRLAADVVDASHASPLRRATAWLDAGDAALAAPHLDAALASLADRPFAALQLADRALAAVPLPDDATTARVRLHRIAALLALGRGDAAHAAVRALLDGDSDDG